MNDPHSNDGADDAPIESMNRHGRRIEEIVAEIDAMADPAARALMQECMESVLGFYGEGIGRMLELVKGADVGGQGAYDKLVRDGVVSGLLLIHGLHPHDLPTRLRHALDKVRPYMESHGGNVELISLENDFARLRLQGSCKSCPSSALTLELAVRRAIEEACPDLNGFAVEGTAETAGRSSLKAEWVEVSGARQIEEGGFLSVQPAGAPLYVCRVLGRLYAYRDRCPACNIPLRLGALAEGLLTCLEGHRFSVREAGRSPDDPLLYLDPFPLIEESGTVRVALAADRPEPYPVPAPV